MGDITALLCCCALLSACGSTAAQYQPIVDGPKNVVYTEDLATCSALAEQRDYLNDDVKSEALLGAGVGAVIGGLEDGWEGAVGAGLLTAAIGAGGRAWDTRQERKEILIECMQQRGHRVVG
ncbi:hypothetical protein BGP75_23095 [Motiliproteus sp. MSK22-1]|nr:hypothetical protein BGP75_23095 [Motiliproteus sp. MSK22-1]